MNICVDIWLTIPSLIADTLLSELFKPLLLQASRKNEKNKNRITKVLFIIVF